MGSRALDLVIAAANNAGVSNLTTKKNFSLTNNSDEDSIAWRGAVNRVGAALYSLSQRLGRPNQMIHQVELLFGQNDLKTDRGLVAPLDMNNIVGVYRASDSAEMVSSRDRISPLADNEYRISTLGIECGARGGAVLQLFSNATIYAVLPVQPPAAPVLALPAPRATGTVYGVVKHGVPTAPYGSGDYLMYVAHSDGYLMLGIPNRDRPYISTGDIGVLYENSYHEVTFDSKPGFFWLDISTDDHTWSHMGVFDPADGWGNSLIEMYQSDNPWLSSSNGYTINENDDFGNFHWKTNNGQYDQWMPYSVYVNNPKSFAPKTTLTVTYQDFQLIRANGGFVLSHPRGDLRSGYPDTYVVMQSISLGGDEYFFEGLRAYYEQGNGVLTDFFVVKINSMPSENLLIRFGFYVADNTGAIAKDITTASIDHGLRQFTLNAGESLPTILNARFDISYGASSSPPSLTAFNTRNNISITVISAEGVSAVYTGIVILKKESKEITDFRLLASQNAASGLTSDVVGVIDQLTLTVFCDVPASVNRTSLLPTFTHTGVVFSPSDFLTQARDFSNPVFLYIVSELSDFNKYTVRVEHILSSSKQMVSFSLLASQNPALTKDYGYGITEATKMITNGVSESVQSAFSSVIPTFSHTGVSSVPAAGVAIDMSKDQTITVYAEDGSSVSYLVRTTWISSEKRILSFMLSVANNPTLPNDISATVDEASKTISASVEYFISLDALVPTITHTGASVTPGSDVVNDFTTPRGYLVIAQDNSRVTYTATITRLLSPLKQLTALSFRAYDNPGQLADIVCAIDEASKTFSGSGSAADPFAMTARISLSARASSTPSSGQYIDTTQPFTITVLAEDGSGAVYTGAIDRRSSQTHVVSFIFRSADNPSIPTDTACSIDTATGLITGSVYHTADRSALIPTITLSTGASILPASGVAQSFLGEVIYVVTAQDGLSTQTYSVNVSRALSPEKRLTSLLIASANNPSLPYSISFVLDEQAKTATASVSDLVPLVGLLPTTTHTGVSVNPPDSLARDFGQAHDLVITAEDGSEATYRVSVVRLRSQKSISKFIFTMADNPSLSEEIACVIDNTALTISAVVSDTASLVLTPTIEVSDGASVLPASGVLNDFSVRQSYVVTAEDGSAASYLIHLDRYADTTCEIVSFVLLGSDNGWAEDVSGTIDQVQKRIEFVMPFGSPLAQRVPTITHTGGDISPPSGAAIDFFATQNYIVVSRSGYQTNQYSVVGTIARNSSKSITTAILEAAKNPALDTDIVGVVDEKTKSVKFITPSTIERDGLVPTITHTGVRLSPESDLPSNLTIVQRYIVYADDDTQSTWFVSAMPEPKTTKSIMAFYFETKNNRSLRERIDCAIDPATKRIYGDRRFDTALLLRPTIAHTGVSIYPTSDMLWEFPAGAEVIYSVKAEDGSHEHYTVVLTTVKEPISLISFKFLAADNRGTLKEDLIGQLVYDTTQTRVAVLVPVVWMQSGALVPSIEYEGSKVEPLDESFDGVFPIYDGSEPLAPVWYQITAADGGTLVFPVVLFSPHRTVLSSTVMSDDDTFIAPDALVEPIIRANYARSRGLVEIAAAAEMEAESVYADWAAMSQPRLRQQPSPYWPYG